MSDAIVPIISVLTSGVLLFQLPLNDVKFFILLLHHDSHFAVHGQPAVFARSIATCHLAEQHPADLIKKIELPWSISPAWPSSSTTPR